jgi:hypothetical protein
MANVGRYVSIEVIHTFVKTDVEGDFDTLRFRIEPENVLGSVGEESTVWHGSGGDLYVVRNEPLTRQQVQSSQNQLVDQWNSREKEESRRLCQAGHS